MGALASLACMLTLLGVPGMNWSLVATLGSFAVFGVALIYRRHQ